MFLQNLLRAGATHPYTASMVLAFVLVMAWQGLQNIIGVVRYVQQVEKARNAVEARFARGSISAAYRARMLKTLDDEVEAVMHDTPFDKGVAALKRLWSKR